MGGGGGGFFSSKRDNSKGGISTPGKLIGAFFFSCAWVLLSCDGSLEYIVVVTD